jgi:hypothetical protein
MSEGSPWTLEVDSVHQAAIVTVRGELADDGLLEIYREIRKAPDIRAGFSLLIDLQDADGRGVTSAGVQALADAPLVFSAEAQRAVVVPSDLGFGMARMYEMLREEGSGRMRVFRDRGEARRWLGLDEESR